MFLLLTGCLDETPVKAPKSRSQALKVKPRKASLDGFCDARPKGRFAWPELLADEPTDAEGWTWVNVWATWCGPCIEEMPMLVEWEKKLSKKGIEVDLRVLSADKNLADVRRFTKKHPDFPTGPQVADAEALGPWLTEMGASAEAGLPAHLFVDREGRVDCVRSGAFNKGNLADLEQLLRQ